MTLAVAGHLLAAYEGGAFGITLFTDRDFARALRWREELPLWGPETTGGSGARLPGAALGLAYALGGWIRPDPTGPFVVVLLGFVAMGAVLYFAGERLRGPWLGVVFAGLALTSPVALSALTELWNPSFAPLPVAVAALGAAEVVRGRPWGLAVAVGGVAVGAQVHGAVGVWGLAAVPGLAWVAPGVLRRGLWPALAVAVAAYLPTLVGAAVLGAPPGALGASAAALMADEARAVEMVVRGVPRLLAAPLDEATAPGGGGAWGPSGVLAALGLAAAIRRGGTSRGAAIVASSQIVLALGMLGLGSRVDLPERYLLPGVPSALYLVALGLDTVREAAGRLGAWAGRVAGVVLLVALVPRLATHATVWAGTSSMSWGAVDAAVGDLRARTGWTDAEVSGRAAWMALPPAGEPGTWEHFPALDHRLAVQGLAFQGSAPPPCALLLRDAPAELSASLSDVGRWVGTRRPPLSVEAPVQLAGGWTLVIYVPDVARCPTSMSQRYVPLPEERVAREAWGRLPQGGVLALPASEGTRFVAHLADCSLPLDACGSTVVVLDLVARPHALRARLSSNQLRGIADNDGWYSATALEAPELVLRRDGDGELRRLTLDADVVGRRYALPPIVAEGPPLTSGTWRVGLEARWFAEDWQDPARRVVDAPLAVELGTLGVP